MILRKDTRKIQKIWIVSFCTRLSQAAEGWKAEKSRIYCAYFTKHGRDLRKDLSVSEFKIGRSCSTSKKVRYLYR